MSAIQVPGVYSLPQVRKASGSLKAKGLPAKVLSSRQRPCKLARQTRRLPMLLLLQF